MSITEQEAREAAKTHEECSRKFFAGELFGIKAHDDYGRSNTTLIEFARQELSRRDAAQAARQQPITPKWCLANGAAFSASWYWFDEGVSLRPIAGGTWLVAVSGQMLNWSAECVGQVEDLRKALRGGV